jgi:hypothetical protein
MKSSNGKPHTHSTDRTAISEPPEKLLQRLFAVAEIILRSGKLPEGKREKTQK